LWTLVDALIHNKPVATLGEPEEIVVKNASVGTRGAWTRRPGRHDRVRGHL
jgi:hypothetical protein